MIIPSIIKDWKPDLLVREAVRDVLERPEYGERARRIRAEIAALPPFEHGLRLLEQLARAGKPRPA